MGSKENVVLDLPHTKCLFLFVSLKERFPTTSALTGSDGKFAQKVSRWQLNQIEVVILFCSIQN